MEQSLCRLLSTVEARTPVGCQALRCRRMTPLKASGEADQSQIIRIRVKPHLDSQHHGQVCQGDQDGFSEEVIMEPTRKAGQE